MKDRVATILSIIKANTQAAVEKSKAEGGILPGIINFVETGDDGFLLETAFSPWGHQTSLAYEVSAGGEFVWIRLTHLFGFLDFREGADAVKLFKILNANSEKAAYLSAAVVDGVPYVSLNNHGSYLAKWNDQDIAQALSDQLARIIMELVIDGIGLYELGVITLKKQ